MPNYELPNNVEVIWEPLPGSQEFAIDSRADHTLLFGTRGSGKTITQLMRFRRYVGIGYGRFWRGVIFDKEFKNLADLEAQSRRYFPQFGDGAKFLSSASDYKWVWPTGEELLFRHVSKDNDYEKFHGHEYPFEGFNELTKWHTSDLYDKLMSVNRSSFVPEKHTPTKLINGKKVYDTVDGKPLPPIPLQFFSTTNSSGPGRNWVKKRFVDPAPYGEIVERKYTVFSARQKQDIEVVRTQTCIFSSYIENPYLPEDYIASLQELTANNENLRKSWLLGSWDVTAGGAFDDLWDSNVHVIDRFPVPHSWRVDRAFDWGSSHPFATVWWAEADGTEYTYPDGRVFCPPRGSLIAVDEFYGTKEIGTNKGIVMSAGDVAKGIRDKEIAMLANGWVSRQPVPGPADNQIRNVIDKKIDTLEKLMAKEGIRWTKSDKSPGSRAIGMQLFRDRLESSLRNEGKSVYFMRNCVCCVETIPVLPRDEKNMDDVDTDAEDHLYDAVRYRILAGSNRIAKNVKVIYPT